MGSLCQRLLVSACLLAASFCFYKAWPGLVGESGPFDSRPAHASSGGFCQVRPDFPPPRMRLRTTPIQDLRVGMRVLGRNPVTAEAERDLPTPDPATWRLVRVRMGREPSQFVDAELLRPLEWLDAEGATPGATIWLELPEMLVEGEAKVLAIEACATLEPRSDPVITGTFRHVAERVVELHAAGLAAPLVCTPQHPFWSVRHAEFVPADHLEVDEPVLTTSGESAWITCIVPREGPEIVYGLEVYPEHVYHVGEAGLLAHNASGRGTGNSRVGTGTTEKGMDRVSSEWRDRYGPASMREHHLVPQAMLDDSQFTNRMREINVSDAQRYIDKQIALLPQAQHATLHDAGWNSRWMQWLDENPEFLLSDVQTQISAMMREFDVPRASRNYVRSYGNN